MIFLNTVLSSLSVAAYSGVVNWGNFFSSFNDRIDYISNQVLPLGGMLIAVFVGWFINLKTVHNDYAAFYNRVFTTWRFSALACSFRRVFNPCYRHIASLESMNSFEIEIMSFSCCSQKVTLCD